MSISKDWCDQAKRSEKRRLEEHHLHTAIRFYRRQYNEGRIFLHKHPQGADSWNDYEMQKLQALPGVYTVTGPMCRFEMQIDHPKFGRGFVRKPTKWVTNSKYLAELLEGECTNRGRWPNKDWHRHVPLIGGVAHLAAEYPPKLVMAVLTAFDAIAKRCELLACTRPP